MLVPVATTLAIVLSVFLSTSNAAPAGCVSHDQPNTIADLYPGNATGVLNATIAVLPITLELARSVIPTQYTILEHAYRDLLPSFPRGMYPLIIQGGHDHDIQLKVYNLAVPDFSRIGFEFPFLDLLGDGYTSFSWHPAQLISAGNPDAIAGSEAYGTLVVPATFEPSCDAYSSVGSDVLFRAAGTTAAPGPSTGCQRPSFAELEFARPGQAGAEAAIRATYPLDFFRNITNQPAFANGTQCDQQIRLFDTGLSHAPYEPRFVEGRVAADMLPLQGQHDWATGIYALQIATPFIENNYLECRSLQGYSSPGSTFQELDRRLLVPHVVKEATSYVPLLV